MRHSNSIRVVIFILLIAVSMLTSAGSQPPGERYFPETGHMVKGEILAFYNSVSDPLLLFGYPITDEFVDVSSGVRTQYFQRVRLDVQTANGTPQVKIADLGGLLYDYQPLKDGLRESGLNCKRFSTGFSVCHDFLAFYRQNQGDIYFGNPIGPMELRDGRTVQYFERARFEWRPELLPDQGVALTDLGRIYFDARVGDPFRLGPTQPGFTINTTPVRLQSYAFVGQALLKPGEFQDLYVIVQDQYYNPVEKATVSVKVTLPGGFEKVYPAPASDAAGLSHIRFPVAEGGLKEVVQVESVISYKGSSASSLTWFRIWW